VRVVVRWREVGHERPDMASTNATGGVLKHTPKCLEKSGHLERDRVLGASPQETLAPPVDFRR
jgi:hypothetical protein